MLPELLTLRARLYNIGDDLLQQNLRPITCVTAEAALLVFDKYKGVMEECDTYVIAVFMCPDHKLKWFADRGYYTDPIRTRIIAAFTELPPPKQQRDTTNVASNTTKSTGRSIWTQRHSSSSASPAHPDYDSIEVYLGSAVVPVNLITQHSGLISYWNHELTSRACVVRMTLNYLTMPVSSVDAERAFSGGHLMINHLQHQMSSRTFQAQIVILSWFNTPLLLSVGEAANIIENHM